MRPLAKSVWAFNVHSQVTWKNCTRDCQKNTQLHASEQKWISFLPIFPEDLMFKSHCYISPYINLCKLSFKSLGSRVYLNVSERRNIMLIPQQGSGYQFREELCLDLKGHTLSLSAVAVSVKSKSVCSLQVLLNWRWSWRATFRSFILI